MKKNQSTRYTFKYKLINERKHIMIDNSLLPEQPSNPFNTTKRPAFTSLQEMNKEALQMLSQKQSELDAYTATVADAEEILSQLQKEVQAKQAELEALNVSELEDNESSILEHDLADLDAKYAKEIEEIRIKHEEEVNALRADFQQTLQEAEQMANRHSEIALQEKLKELNELKQQAQNAKFQLNEMTYIQTKSRTSKALNEAQRNSSDQIVQLERQISELTAITREEMRDARAKIDECVAAVELRRRNHADELKRLQAEAEQRNEKYSAHLQALREQFDLEKATLQQNIDAIIKRSDNTESIINQLGKHQDTQLSIVNNDIETMKKSLSASPTNNKNSIDSTRNSIRESQRLVIECKNIDDEVKLIDNEINQLEDENKILRKELKRLSSIFTISNY